MTRQPTWLCTSLATLLLAAIVGLTMTTSVDIRISDAIFAAGGGAWPLPHAGWTRAVGYEGPKYAVIGFALLTYKPPQVLFTFFVIYALSGYVMAVMALKKKRGGPPSKMGEHS